LGFQRRSRNAITFRFTILMKSWCLTFLLVLAGGGYSAFGQLSGTNPLVRFKTDFGEINVLLLQDVAPNNVANFLKYVKRGDYDNSFIHRSIADFVIQGGGFKFINNQVVPIEPDPPVVNEFHVSNRRGTLAMAKTPNNPNSATSQWFFNESDSNASGPDGLDTQNGGFTVFGRITDKPGLTTMDAIAAVRPIIDADGMNAHTFDQLPVVNWIDFPVQDQNLVHVLWVKVVPQIVAVTRVNATTVHIQGRGTASTTYKLYMSSSPTGSTFSTSVNVTTGTQGNFNYDDTAAGAKKFYRVSIP